MDEDELLAEMEYEESELADQAGGDSSGMTEIILIGFLTVSLLVGGSAAAATAPMRMWTAAVHECGRDEVEARIIRRLQSRRPKDIWSRCAASLSADGPQR